MKKALALMLALITLCSLTACDAAAKEGTAATSATATSAAATDAVAAVTAEETGSRTVYDTSAYADMTVEELYLAALAEGKTLSVYTETNSTEKSLKGFYAKYPGLTVEVTKFKNYELDAKAEQEFLAGQAYGDVFIGGDSSGEKYTDWYSNGYVLAYVPTAYEEDLYPAYAAYGLPVTIECAVWYYSTALYPEGSPITNWWDIVAADASGNGKYRIFLNDITNDSTCGVLCNLIANAQELEQAYLTAYGEPLTYTYDAAELGVEANNAGYEWLYRFLQNGYTVINDSAEIITAVDGCDVPALGLSTTLKYGDALEAGQSVMFTTALAPFNGFAKVKYIYIAANTDAPATARLFALYSMGFDGDAGTVTDAEGNTVDTDGYGYYVNRKGVYGTRLSHDDTLYNTVSFEALDIRPSDIGFVYENAAAVRDFWTYYSDIFAR